LQSALKARSAKPPPLDGFPDSSADQDICVFRRSEVSEPFTGA